MAGLPKELIGNPADLTVGGVAGDDVLSDVLRHVRLSGSLQFCFMPTGAWQTDAKPSLAKSAPAGSSAIPFHILVEGTCWLKMDGREVVLAEGDVVAFPFGTGHQLGAGRDGRLILPGRDLPPKPWREVPVLQYGKERQRVRLLCGYLQCNAISFRPLREALPTLLHVRPREAENAAWLRAAIAQIVAEVDNPRAGGLSMLERLTEITFIELLRYQMIAAPTGSGGWLAALADPALARCFSLIHSDPKGAQSMKCLADAAGLSRSTLSERFDAMLGTSPMRYVREWRLCLASVALSTTRKSIAVVAHDAGYGTEAAFNRAFARAYGAPPASWRQQARQGA